MDLKPGLWQQQTLKLQMTQELSQAIALLQYSTQELTSFLEEKAIENPLLKIEHGQTIEPTSKNRSKGKIPKDKQSWIEQIGTETKTLDVYLHSQINMKKLTKDERIVIEELIYNIDKNGYLCISLEEVAMKLQTTLEKVAEGLTLIQELEPAGVGARDLKECLFLQLIRKEKKHPLAEKIIQNHFNLFAEKKWKELAKRLKVTPAEIQKVFDAIQVLNPRPASVFQREPAVYIIPDVVIQWDGEAFNIRVFDEALPKISFNDQYYKQFSAHQDKQVGRFLQEKQQDFFWIVRALEQRKETLTKVAVKIVERQHDFFTKGPSYIKPMTMKDISEELDIHESTVSRAVREKYAQTPFGLYDLKFFFSSTIQTISEESTSSRQVRDLIKTLVEMENKQRPLSDQEIVNVLNEENGIVVSRRTIAKYRDQLGIPSSSKRKRYE